MKICVFDTETTSLDLPYCYNIGYVIIDSDNWEVLARRSYVVEQVWHNLPLFSSAYYANKRPIYVASMKARKTVMDKYGYICQKMIRDFRNFEVELAFAYNSAFDEKVFNFNCDWYKCNNPFDNIPVKDIRGFVHNFIVDKKLSIPGHPSLNSLLVTETIVPIYLLFIFFLLELVIFLLFKLSLLILS